MGHTVSHSIDILEISSQKDAIALACCFWLYDKRLCFFTIELCSEVTVFSWKKPSLRIEPIFMGELSTHSIEISSKLIFPSNSMHCWEVSDSLIRLKSNETIRSNSCITPAEIPINRLTGFFLPHYFHFKVASTHKPNHFILCVSSIQNKSAFFPGSLFILPCCLLSSSTCRQPSEIIKVAHNALNISHRSIRVEQSAFILIFILLFVF